MSAANEMFYTTFNSDRFYVAQISSSAVSTVFV